MNPTDLITADCLKETRTICVWMALFSKLEDEPRIIEELEELINTMRRVAILREQGVELNEIIVSNNLPRLWRKTP